MTRVEVGPNYPDRTRVDTGVFTHPAIAKTIFTRSHDSDDSIKRKIRWVEIQTGTAPDYLRLPTPPPRMTTLSFNPETPSKFEFTCAISGVNAKRTAAPRVFRSAVHRCANGGLT